MSETQIQLPQADGAGRSASFKTLCYDCGFYAGNKVCKLNRLEVFKELDKVEWDDEHNAPAISTICTAHRSEEWMEENPHPFTAIKKATQIQYDLVVTIQDNILENVKTVIDKVNTLSIPPKKIILAMKTKQLNRKELRKLTVPTCLNFAFVQSLVDEELEDTDLVDQAFKSVQSTYYYHAKPDEINDELVEAANKTLNDQLNFFACVRQDGYGAFYAKNVHKMLRGNRDVKLLRKIKEVLEDQDRGEKLVERSTNSDDSDCESKL